MEQNSVILGKDSLSCDQNDQIDLIVEINLSPKTEESNWSSQNLLVIPCVHSVHFTVIKNYQAKTIKSLPIIDTPISDKLIYSCERHQTSQKQFYPILKQVPIKGLVHYIQPQNLRYYGSMKREIFELKPVSLDIPVEV